MNLKFVPKEADKAYVSNRLWLPKSGIRPGPVKRALEFVVPGRDGQVKMEMWDESSRHIICPREFIPPSHYPEYPFQFVDLRPQFGKVDFKDNIRLRDEEQELAWAPLSRNENGILNLACGKGKTVLALKKAAQKKTPTLVIVPDGGILSQWRETIIGNKAKGTPGAIEFDGELGIVQGPMFDWARPITLALITTLALRIRDDKLPEEFFRYFGFVIYDEVHQLGAPVFSLTAPPFYGDRLGLSATVRREDGLDPIFRYHIGEPFYSDMTQDLVPEIYFLKAPTVIDYDQAKVNGQTNMGILRTTLGRDLEANTYRYWAIKEMLDQGRKVLVLSHSKDQLRLMHAAFPGSGLIISETDQDERMQVLRSHQLCFAIAKLGSTGVDDPRLDCLIWLTPFKSRISLQQSMGRIQRFFEGKKTPLFIIIEDWTIPPLKNLCKELKSILKEWKFQFNVLPPRRFPADLPRDVRRPYDRAFAELPDRLGAAAEDEDED